MSLCPEFDKRAAMTDDEYWDHVSANLGHPQGEPEDYYYDGPDLDVAVSQGTCELCGSEGACAYDAEGRPLIHAVEATDE